MLDDNQHSPSGRDRPPDPVARDDPDTPTPRQSTRAIDTTSHPQQTPVVDALSSTRDTNPSKDNNPDPPDSPDSGGTMQKAIDRNPEPTWESSSRKGDQVRQTNHSTPDPVFSGAKSGSNQHHQPAPGSANPNAKYQDQSKSNTENQKNQKNTENYSPKKNITENTELEKTEKNEKKQKTEKNPKNNTLVSLLDQPSKGFLKRIRFKEKTSPETEKSEQQIYDSDYNFLRNETKAHHGGPNASFKATQAKRIFERKSKNSNFLDFLNSLPENEISMKFDVINQFDMSINDMEKSIDKLFMNEKDYCMGKILSTLRRLKITDEEFNIGTTSLGDEHIDDLDEISDLVCTAIACVIIANVRFIKNKAYFMCAKSIHTIKYITTHIVPRFHRNNIITQNEVTERVYDLLFKRQIFDTDNTGKFFTLEKSPSPSGRFLWATVSYLPMSNPQDYFEQSFLTPGDVITSWSPDNSSSPNGKETADVMIDLILDKTPPRRLIMDRIKQQLQHVISSNKFDGLIKKDKEKLNEMLDDNDGVASPATESLREAIARAEIKATRFKGRVLEVIASTQQQRQYEPREDPAQMTCIIEYNEQFCPICHTTAHSLRTCPIKGCSLCSRKNHPFYKCPSKCKCSQKPIHLEGECARRRAQSNKVNPVSSHFYNQTQTNRSPTKLASRIEENPFAKAFNEPQGTGTQETSNKKNDHPTYITSRSPSSEESTESVSQSNTPERRDERTSIEEQAESNSHHTNKVTNNTKTSRILYSSIHHQKGSTIPNSTSPAKSINLSTTPGLAAAQSSMSTIGSFTTQSGYHVPHSSPRKQVRVDKPLSETVSAPTQQDRETQTSTQSSMPSLGGSLTTVSGTHIPDHTSSSKDPPQTKDDTNQAKVATVNKTERRKSQTTIPPLPTTPPTQPELTRQNEKPTQTRAPPISDLATVQTEEDTEEDEPRGHSYEPARETTPRELQTPFQEAFRPTKTTNSDSPVKTTRLMNLKGIIPGQPVTPKYLPSKRFLSSDSDQSPRTPSRESPSRGPRLSKSPSKRTKTGLESETTHNDISKTQEDPVTESPSSAATQNPEAEQMMDNISHTINSKSHTARPEMTPQEGANQEQTQRDITSDYEL